MILAADVGNTHIVTGCLDGGRTLFAERLSTDSTKTEIEYVMGFETVFNLYHIRKDEVDGAIISSVVPPLTGVLAKAIEKIIGKKPLIVGPGIKTGLNLLMDDPKEVGADLVTAAVAGINGYGAPLIIIDMGTATTITAVDKNGSFIGGAIMPGIKASLQSLVMGTAQLPEIGLTAPAHAIGKNTADCMNSGIVLGCASMIDGMISRMEEELGSAVRVIATGGWAQTVIPMCRHEITVDNELILKGLNIIYCKNIEKGHKNI